MILALQILGGFIGLLLGGELLVRGAAAIASRLGMSPLVVGVVIVGFGTSMPELVTSVRAALVGAPGIAMGNIVGSNICNILLILGAAALLRPFVTSRAAVLRDGSIVILTAALFAAAAMTGTIERWMGAAFLVALVFYIAYTLHADRRDASGAAALESAGSAENPAIDDIPDTAGTPLWRSLVHLFGGLVVVLLGAEYLVRGAVEVATLANISEEVIGLTLVAIGTSLPELVTSVVAAIRRHSEIALGNVLGSNVYNTIGIGGATAVVSPIPVSNEMRFFDVPLMVAISILLVVVVATGRKVTRWEGGGLLALYGGYIVFLAQSH
ncbi:MAG: calcium/sodium antiporter [Acuticoccus sp.]